MKVLFYYYIQFADLFFLKGSPVRTSSFAILLEHVSQYCLTFMDTICIVTIGNNNGETLVHFNIKI